MSYRVYIVEDERTIAEELRLLLAQWGCEAAITTDFRAVTEEVKAFDPQLILMDVGLPYYNGYYWCGEIRRFSTAPIVFLSSASDNMNIVMAMDMGGDDFIAKPFDPAVLMAKLRSVLRRSYDFTAAAPTLAYRGARLNPADQSLSCGEKRLELSRNEYRILLTLLENRGCIVSREKLMEALWQTDSFVDENTLTVNVNRLRKKLDALGLEGYIATKFGVGYGIGVEG